MDIFLLYVRKIRVLYINYSHASPREKFHGQSDKIVDHAEPCMFSVMLDSVDTISTILLTT